ncbi:hypothetical protein [Yersinia pekkanenii]|uniref:Uncharacterized protein n=1 Tax=Yersinia pekkanenii TaxID=1288385 RepID=A0A0T9RRC7_9GAMM|nr:hypothetical protein [Yersinia pekkanenii]CNI78327.1 Uncharacterised protein [Yersinia pekkanenii]CRY69675.1 Uncharacterised protein [Yersinia pekkanenii]
MSELTPLETVHTENCHAIAIIKLACRELEGTASGNALEAALNALERANNTLIPLMGEGRHA